MSEALWALLQPSSLMVVAIALSLVATWFRWHALAASLLTLVLVGIAVVVVLPVTAWLAGPLEDQVPPVPLPSQVDGILVLGGAVEWRITTERGQLTLNDAGERVAAAAALAQRYPGARLVFTGVFGDAFEQDFRAQGTERSLWFGPVFAGRDISYLGAARSTYEDAIVALRETPPRPGETWLLVTSAMHMPRALATFKNQGWTDLVPYPVDFRSTGRATIGLDWDVAGTLADLDQAVREWGALEVYRRVGRIAP